MCKLHVCLMILTFKIKKNKKHLYGLRSTESVHRMLQKLITGKGFNRLRATKTRSAASGLAPGGHVSFGQDASHLRHPLSFISYHESFWGLKLNLKRFKKYGYQVNRIRCGVNLNCILCFSHGMPMFWIPNLHLTW